MPDASVKKLAFSEKAFFVIFAISGVSGLIYESIWSHYMKLFLGHAAYAQTVTLMVYMGGMAIGSYLASRMSGKVRNLIAGYAIVEGITGLIGLFFHQWFVEVNTAVLAAISGFAAPEAAHALKWLVAGALITPQSILLGMSFPFMSVGLIRKFNIPSGRAIASLYFFNSFGAAFGSLFSGFYLIKNFGLPGTILVAAIINILLAVVSYAMAKGADSEADFRERERYAIASPARGEYSFFLFVALVTGLSSFIYEIGWIRMLTLLLGGATHSFEIMLSAFILGIAFGGLWIRRRIDSLDDPVRFLAWAQALMGLMALLTIPVYDATFSVMEYLMAALTKTPEGYSVFNVSRHFISLIVMTPATFFAGMTLPLITNILLKRGHGDRSVGAVYAANTVGAIAGVAIAVHFGMPFLGLKWLIVLGAAMDITLGAWILARSTATNKYKAVFAVAFGFAIVSASFLFEINAYKTSSGVYRYGVVPPKTMARILYHKDGKTSTVDMLDHFGGVTLKTNGKSDANIQMRPDALPSVDEPTMVLLGAIPMSMAPQAKTAAVIGLGSGLTAHTILGSKRLEKVDTIEIEPAVVTAARLYLPRVERVYNDRRSEIFIDDARTFFPLRNKRYDIIISEPSNPWVSGISSLFTEEFYGLVARYLNDGGVFAQWVQLYEIDPKLVGSIMNAIAANFPDYVFYNLNDIDMLIVAVKSGKVPSPDKAAFDEIAASNDMKRLWINSIEDLKIRRVGGKRLEGRMFSMLSPANSDYFPFLDVNADRARYVKSDAKDLMKLQNLSLPVLPILEKNAGFDPWLTSETQFLGFRKEVKSAIETVEKTDLCKRLSSFNDERQAVAELVRLAAPVAGLMTPVKTAEFWKRIVSTQCGGITGIERWVALFMAVERGDGPVMAGEADYLMKNGDLGIKGVKDYLTAVKIVGLIASGERRSAFMELQKEGVGRSLSERNPLLPGLLLSFVETQ
ncbi:MAG: fused MFS/spermidine synthase [Nitrospinae bacterium]|nr:fused MFS/spermidine synthase [Nitrospinota bacterium]MBF0633129.1 fused MFS/spermidine synthase [Nitrospinota bacterium]